MRVLSLFSGCGGFDLGFIQAGHEIVCAIDFFTDAVNTYTLNIGNHIINGDIRKIKSEDLPNDIDIVLGGFPCQGFSVSNNNRKEEDERNFLYREMLRIIKDKQPKFFVAENVLGILSLAGGKVFQMILNDFSNLGYKVEYRVLLASDYGVPQNRQRVIILGNKLNKENKFPAQTHYAQASIFSSNEHISTKQAIGFLADVPLNNSSFDLNGVLIHNHIANVNVSDVFLKRKYDVDQKEIADYLLKNKKISISKIDKILGYNHTASHWFRKDAYGSLPTKEDWIALKEILNFDDTYDEKMLTFEEKTITFDQTLRISNWDSPSDTLTASGPEIHPNKQRRLSVRECAIIQGFPMDFVFTGCLSTMYKQIGNAVPPPLAYAIAKELSTSLHH
jgi:DNA (cytosine-5)-methyltransferase 1